MFFTRRFVLGLGVGIAITVVVLDIWGRYLVRQEVYLAQPRLVQPFNRATLPVRPQSSQGLGQPWLPTAPNAANDDWVLRPLGGQPTSLAQLKGKVVFLNFWSTTCMPCIAEMPGIEALHNSLKNEPVSFLAVTQDDEKSVRAFLREYPIAVPVYLAGRDVAADLTPGGLPTTFILDREGAVVYREVGAANWDDDRVRTFIRGLTGQ